MGLQGKARLGAVVHKKTATAVALTVVKNEDQREFAKVCAPNLHLLPTCTLSFTQRRRSSCRNTTFRFPKNAFNTH